MSKKKIILIGVILLLALQVEFFFAWTSHVGGASHVLPSNSELRSILSAEVYAVTSIQFGFPGVASFYTSLAHGVRSSNYRITYPMKLFIDTEVIVFTLAIFALSILLFFRKGIFIALLRTFEITSAMVLPLGIWIYAYDNGQYNIHASDVQVKLGLAWFTNADVLYTSATILGVCILIEAVLFLRRRNAPRPDLEPSNIAPPQNIHQ
jgi:hypothetical protein